MKLDVFKDELNFSEAKGVLYKEIGNYTFYLTKYQVDALSHINAFVVVFSKTLSKLERKEISHMHGMPMMRVESIGLIENALVFPIKFKPTSKKFELYFNKLLTVFDRLELKSLDYCPYCGAQDTDGSRIIKGARIDVHESCVKSFVSKVEAHLETEGKSSKHQIKSILLAMVFGVIGLLPSIIILELFEFYSAWLFLIIPFASFYGFKKGGAQRRGYVIYLVSLITFILAVGYMLLIYYSISVYLEVTFYKMLEDTEILASFASDMITTVLFSALAIFISWKYINKHTHRGIKKDIKALKR